MNSSQPTTRHRLIAAATTLFAERGYRGASVRDICNQARANPGAVSYHFGGKRQLYRVVLRQATEAIAATRVETESTDGSVPPSVRYLVTLLRQVQLQGEAKYLLLRDLADGGSAAVEALVPVLRTAYRQLRTGIDAGDEAGNVRSAQVRFLRLAAPLFLLTAGWPVLERTLDLDSSEQESLLEEMLLRCTE